MVRNIVLLLVFSLAFTSCCYRRPTSAQSDRWDTHHPQVPVIECIPCGDLRNKPENFIWTEARGTSNRWMVGGEYGFNFDNFRLFADAGTRWWPNGNLTWAHRQQIGFVPFNPNNKIHPEIGIDLHQRYFRSYTTMVTPTGDQLIRNSPEYYWQTFAGIRFAIPYSNVVLGTRVYRLQDFSTKAADWNFGIQLSFRL